MLIFLLFQGKSPKVELYLKVEMTTETGLEFITDEIKLTNKNATIFQYIQSLIALAKKDHKSLFANNPVHFEKMKSVWDMNYRLTYREVFDPDSPPSQPIEIESVKPDKICTADQVLRLLTILKSLVDKNSKEFISEKINNKLVQQLQDPLVLASRSIPKWCKTLVHSCKFLFPFDTRQLYFTTTAFGVSRSIVWLQNKRDALLSTLRGPASQRLMRDEHEFRIGRLKHERIKIPRDPSSSLLKAAINALKFHATRKAVLEIEFVDEEGTGLGPTLEFFSLIAAELQKKKYAMWHCDDNAPDDVDSDAVFVHHANGLFPAPYPTPDSIPNDKLYQERYQNLIDLFNFMGIFLAKSLQDQRLVDLPFSYSLLKILCDFGDEELGDYLNKVFDLDDLEMIEPTRGALLKSLRKAIESRKANKSENEPFMVEVNGTACKLEDLGLVFEYNPPSKVHGYSSHRLIPNGENIVRSFFHFEYEIIQILISY